MVRGRGRGFGGRGRRSSGATAATKKGTGKGSAASGSGSKTNSQNSKEQPEVPNIVLPVVPEKYPNAGKPVALNAQLDSLVPIFLELTQFFKSNYSVPVPESKYPSAFSLPRYSDRYNEPLRCDPKLLHRPDPKRLPDELLSKGSTKSIKQPYVEFNVMKRLQELSKMEEDNEKQRQKLAKEVEETEGKAKIMTAEKTTASTTRSVEEEDEEELGEEEELEIEEIDIASDDEQPKVKKVKYKIGPKNTKSSKKKELADATDAAEEDKAAEGDEEDEEEQDEELDDETDYMNNYFDNGEEYLEEDDDGADDNAVY